MYILIVFTLLFRTLAVSRSLLSVKTPGFGNHTTSPTSTVKTLGFGTPTTSPTSTAKTEDSTLTDSRTPVTPSGSRKQQKRNRKDRRRNEEKGLFLNSLHWKMDDLKGYLFR